MIKETGIIMFGDHPIKILNGTKTMTRRIWGLEKINENLDKWHLSAVFLDGKARFYSDDGEDITFKCPYGGIGDLLWVRETWALTAYPNQEGSIISHWYAVYKDGNKKEINPPELWLHKHKEHLFGNWRPSIFMPRWASRALLKITELGAERLQAISDSDIVREGIDVTFHKPGDFGIENPCATAAVDLPNGHRVYSTAKECWIELWDSLNGKKYPMSMNPWVWVISF